MSSVFEKNAKNRLAADTAKQQTKAELFSCNAIYMGCYSSYFLAERAGDTDRLAVLEERYALLFDRLPKGGFDPKALPTILYTDLIALSDTAAEEAWTHWHHRYDRLTGYPLPEDAPTIEKK